MVPYGKYQVDDLTEDVLVEDDPALNWNLHKVMVYCRHGWVNHERNEEEE